MARIVGLTFAAKSIVDAAGLIDVLTTWRIALPDDYLSSLANTTIGTAIQQPPWEFQTTCNAYHHPSRNEWSEYPCWTIDIYDRQQKGVGVIAPKGLFHDKATGEVFPDVGALVKNWCRDSQWRQFNTVQNAYRVVIPDQRGFISAVSPGKDEIRVAVVSGSRAKLRCALTTDQNTRGEKSETKSVVKGTATFAIRSKVNSLDVHLIDDSDEWCDRYWNGQAALLWQEPIDSSRGPYDELLRLLGAPRYSAALQHLQKATAFLTAEKLDLANAAKESICAVESIAKVMSGQHELTLGRIVRILEKEKRIAPAMAAQMHGFWAKTSDMPGVRHGAAATSTTTQAEIDLVIQKTDQAIRYLLERDLYSS